MVSIWVSVGVCVYWCISGVIFNCILNGYKHLIIEYPSFENLLNAYGLIAFQFDIHPMLMTIQVDMYNKSKISNAVCYGALSKLFKF